MKHNEHLLAEAVQIIESLMPWAKGCTTKDPRRRDDVINAREWLLENGHNPSPQNNPKMITMNDLLQIRLQASEIIRQLYLDGCEDSIEILKLQCERSLEELRASDVPKKSEPPKKAKTPKTKRRKNLNAGVCCSCLHMVQKGEGNIEVFGNIHYLTCPKCFPPGISANAERSYGACQTSTEETDL